MSYSNSHYYSKPKGKASKVITWIAVILVVCALCGLIPNFFNNKDGDFKRIYVGWNVGTLKEDGKFDSDVKDAIVSDRIKIEGGLKLVIDFESCATYDVYLYNENDVFLEIDSSGLSNTYSFTPDGLLPDAYYVRIVLHPVDKNNVINVFEKVKYANLLEIFRAPLEEDTTSTEE